MAKKVKENTPMHSTSSGSAESQPLPTITNSLGMILAIVPKGTAAIVLEECTHKGVRVRVVKKKIPAPFLMGLYQVTQSQYQKVMGINPSEFKGPEHPVEMVSWGDANEFCERLTAVPDELTAGRAYRLPSAEEWEYVCRAGTGTTYSFGDDSGDLGKYAWFGGLLWTGPTAGNSGKTTHPVGEKEPNPWGLFDMHGNVWEWCSTEKPAMRTERVLKGGSYYHGTLEAKCHSRMHYKENTRSSYVGLRVAADFREIT
jgi:formylglycine-generating enzyme required for sulfatase activity